MQAKGTRRNTGSPSGDRSRDQLAARERQAGPRAYQRVYGEARELAYRSLAEGLARRRDVIWEIGSCGSAYSDLLDWLKQLGYRISVCAVNCSVEDALARHERRFSDPAEPLHFGRDPAWYAPPQPDAGDLEEIKRLYDIALNSLDREVRRDIA